MRKLRHLHPPCPLPVQSPSTHRWSTVGNHCLPCHLRHHLPEGKPGPESAGTTWPTPSFRKPSQENPNLEFDCHRRHGDVSQERGDWVLIYAGQPSNAATNHPAKMLDTTSATHQWIGGCALSESMDSDWNSPDNTVGCLCRSTKFAPPNHAFDQPEPGFRHDRLGIRCLPPCSRMGF